MFATWIHKRRMMLLGLSLVGLLFYLGQFMA